MRFELKGGYGVLLLTKQYTKHAMERHITKSRASILMEEIQSLSKQPSALRWAYTPAELATNRKPRLGAYLVVEMIDPVLL